MQSLLLTKRKLQLSLSRLITPARDDIMNGLLGVLNKGLYFSLASFRLLATQTLRERRAAPATELIMVTLLNLILQLLVFTFILSKKIIKSRTWDQ